MGGECTANSSSGEAMTSSSTSRATSSTAPPTDDHEWTSMALCSSRMASMMWPRSGAGPRAWCSGGGWGLAPHALAAGELARARDDGKLRIDVPQAHGARAEIASPREQRAEVLERGRGEGLFDGAKRGRERPLIGRMMAVRQGAECGRTERPPRRPDPRAP
jgi:hypothetical protein